MRREELGARTKKFALRVMKMRSPRDIALFVAPVAKLTGLTRWRALEEADESLLWLELIEEGGLVPARKIGALKQEAAELTAIFAAIHKTSKS